jgi:transglutaminase-like putative cysteine protease
MLIHLGCELQFNVPSPVPLLAKLYLHPTQTFKLRTPERFRIEPEAPLEEFNDEFGNRVGRTILPVGTVRMWTDAVVEDDARPDPIVPTAQQHPVEDLPVTVLPFLLSSRYCEVDRLCETALALFGHTAPGWARVQSICDWVHSNVRFGYEYACPTKTAYDVYTERRGVCRDFMHLAITFCRCLNIPARYATGYLGDIGVPLQPFPMDFSAWFEVYLDRQWHTFDARHNQPRIGRILIARGRDAVDAALTTSFGPTVKLEKFAVWTTEVSEIPPFQ